MSVRITGTGSYIPKSIEKNEDFHQHQFLNIDGSSIDYPNEVIVEKFKAITGIVERRYADPQLTSSDLGFLAGQKAIEDANIDPEEIDYIICAHNFGDVKANTVQSDILPCLASRIKHRLRIKNPKCVAYDILFGCPGWVEGVIQAKAFIKAGMAKKCLVIGSETLSRVVDKHDRDSMIYSDGAGATIVEASDEEGGILAHESASFTYDEAYYLFFGNSNNKDLDNDTRYIKMHGRKIYEFALSNVPQAMKACLDKSGVDISDVKKVLIHQANEKMDEAIIKRFYRLYKAEAPEGIMPMSIHKLGNSSVATVPTLFDLIVNNKLDDHSIKKGDVIIFASVGAGMHINAFVYKY
ncbi:ketoacyl-ACP synthase III [Psychroserpens sp.]|uniref:3-oxoacyl-ACP synthase III family protein n=1 Tax=Psychroserpens sp. TaxID=2020870 RepID=UPI001AFE5F89|nr:ketoacyl-ACP synthase III [Psychroserpens sp.]MBO6606175.1 ketoacyl-ACP synthase III [Psychroserpens sp.]MBO6652453.1 ketoacyl-ACP synthase III [Psychroserpens sp.]MBO6681775.1 ketoacyl-ACP synthase III [Psychroserpens sp.]MBO6749550.1 ketoacyl-ACP synthase III [Psychroserpens sp.]MBO6914005.1 ketoacyl-ACP synthase III [Psychroserpens sp.]